jgi:hypothetical protein
MSCVYALVAKSNPDEMRYIGKSKINTPVYRFQSHLKEAEKVNKNTHKLNWIRKVLDAGDQVLVVTLESNLSLEEYGIREEFWIAHYRSLEHRLTNATDGGDGSVGRTVTEETREKLRAASTGRPWSQETREKQQRRVRSLETREKLRVAATGRFWSEEEKERHRLRMSAPETKERLRAVGLRRRLSDETKAKISETLKRK